MELIARVHSDGETKLLQKENAILKQKITDQDIEVRRLREEVGELRKIMEQQTNTSTIPRRGRIITDDEDGEESPIHDFMDTEEEHRTEKTYGEGNRLAHTHPVSSVLTATPVIGTEHFIERIEKLIDNKLEGFKREINAKVYEIKKDENILTKSKLDRRLEQVRRDLSGSREYRLQNLNKIKGNKYEKEQTGINYRTNEKGTGQITGRSTRKERIVDKSPRT